MGQSYRRVALRAGPQWPSWWGWWTRKTKDSSWISSSPWRFSSCNHQKQRGISPLKSNECLVVDLPLWKIRFRQLGFSYSQYMENTNCSKPPTRIWCWFNQHWGIKRNFSKTNWAKIGFHTQQWGVGLGFDSKNSWNTLKCAIQLMSTLTGATPWDVLGSPPCAMLLLVWRHALLFQQFSHRPCGSTTFCYPWVGMSACCPFDAVSEYSERILAPTLNSHESSKGKNK